MQLQKQQQKHGRSSRKNNARRILHIQKEDIAMKKKFLVIAVSLCMIFTSMPAPVFAGSIDRNNEKSGISGYAADRSRIAGKHRKAAVSMALQNLPDRSSLKKGRGADTKLEKDHKERQFAAQTNETEYAASIGDERYETLKAAVDAAASGDTVKLLKDTDSEGCLVVDDSRPADFSLTIDLAGHELCTYDAQVAAAVYSGNVTIKNGIVSNLYRIIAGSGKADDTQDTPADDSEPIVAVYAENATVDLYNVIVYTLEDEAVGVFSGKDSKVTMDRCSYHAAFDIAENNDDEIEGYQACFADTGSKLDIRRSYIETNYGDGIVSAGSTYIEDSAVITNQEENGMIAEPVYAALTAYGGGSICVNDGFYYGAPAIMIADESPDGTSNVVITKGEFRSPEKCPATANWFSDTDFGSRISIASGCRVTPAGWKTELTNSLLVYKNTAAPAKVTSKLGSYDSVTVSWSKVKDAAGYQVYYKKSSDKKYSYLGRTAGLSMTKKKLSQGKKYSFVVYACDSLNYELMKGRSSKKTDIYTLKKVGKLSVKRTDSKYVTVKWQNISGETGYQISKSTSRSKTSIAATYKTTTGKSKKIKAKRGPVYYYKVRAYKDYGSKRVYAPWSAVKAY